LNKHTVLQVITGLGTGGAEKMLLSLVSNPDGFRFVVCCLKNNGAVARQIERAGVPVHCLNCDTLTLSAAVPRLLRIIEHERPAIVHSHIASADVIAGIACGMAGLPHVSTRHSAFEHWDGSPVLGGVYRRVMRRNVLTIAVSTHVWDFLTTRLGVDANRVVVIRNGVPIPPRPAANARQPRNGKLAVGMLARLDRVKGVDLFLAAAAAVVRSRPGTRFVVAGDGPERAGLARLSAELGIADDVEFLGWRDDIGTVMGRMDVFVAPSRAEGLGVSLLEAMAHGVTPVAFDIGGIPEVISHGFSGVLVPAGSVPDLAAEIVRVIDDPELRERLGNAARARVAEAFTLERMISETGAVYERVLAGAPSVSF
jgi:glycosyltransferase involved in cell wall biosynthesis